MNHNFSTEEYNYSLPPELIAETPCSPRDQSRMLVVNSREKIFKNQHVHELTDFLPPQSLLVVNNTKVLPGRLIGHRKSGAAIEALLLQAINTNIWECKVKNSVKIKLNEEIFFGEGNLRAILQKKDPDKGTCLLKFPGEEPFHEQIEKYGLPPLPPYILKKRKEPLPPETDKENYQTLFAKKYGALAAPTAGLHFTERLMNRIREKKIEIAEITLHVGAGTFNPVKTEDLRQHKMHSEFYSISDTVAHTINRAKKEKRKIICVGTTSVRALEAAAKKGMITKKSGMTDIFIYPPYPFQMTDILLTNFHLPKSSLIMLVSAFIGKEKLMEAYQFAIEKKYRFYSYGDCGLFIP